MQNNIYIKQLIKYLDNSKLSNNTKEHYKKDVNYFFDWINKKDIDIVPSFNQDLLKQYETYLINTKTPQSTIKRRLTGIKHLYKAIGQDNKNQYSILDEYLFNLTANNTNKKTLRFYKSDIKLFIDYLNINQIDYSDIDKEVLRNFYYFTVRKQSVSTAKRRASSVKGFIEWLSENSIEEDQNINISKYNFYNRNITQPFGILLVILLLTIQILTDKHEIKLPWTNDVLYARDNTKLNYNYKLEPETKVIFVNNGTPLIKLNDYTINSKEEQNQVYLVLTANDPTNNELIDENQMAEVIEDNFIVLSADKIGNNKFQIKWNDEIDQ